MTVPQPTCTGAPAQDQPRPFPCVHGRSGLLRSSHYLDASLRAAIVVAGVAIVYAELARRGAKPLWPELSFYASGPGWSGYFVPDLSHVNAVYFPLVDLEAPLGLLHLEAIWRLVTWWPVTAFLVGAAALSLALEWHSSR